jgi:hypothetical protein
MLSRVNASGPAQVARFAVIGDVHAHFAYLDEVLGRVAQEPVDALLFVGDLGSHDLSYARRRTPERDARYLASIEEVLRRARTVCAEVLYVPGNHDLPDLGFAGNVDGRVRTIAGVRIGGIGGAGPGRFGFAYEWDDDQIRARPALACDLLLCHAPPQGTTLDQLVPRPEHVGSAAIRELAQRHTGALVCGHIHEAAGVELVGACLCLNAGGLGAPFGAAQVGFVTREADGSWYARHESFASGRVRELRAG